MAIEITARKREAQGTGPSRRLRNAGKVPGILYGGDQGPVNIELDHKDLFIKLKNVRFHASILTLELAGTKEQVLLRAVNMHPFKLQVQHVDFQRVVKDKKIHMKVPLHFVNAEKSPGVKEQGGVTFMWIFLSLTTRWKSTCCTCSLNGCMLTARSSTCCFAPARSRVRIEAWNLSFFRLMNRSLWSSSMLSGPWSPP